MKLIRAFWRFKRYASLAVAAAGISSMAASAAASVFLVPEKGAHSLVDLGKGSDVQVLWPTSLISLHASAGSLVGDAPSMKVQSPRDNSIFALGTTVTVALDVSNGTAGEAEAMRVEVTARDEQGFFVVRAEKVNVRYGPGGTLRWIGRIKWPSLGGRSSFVVNATLFDKAGHSVVVREVTCSFGG